MRNRALTNAMINSPLRPVVQHLEARRAVFNETEDAATQDAAYMEVLAAQMELRAEIHRARLALAARLDCVNPAEAQRIRESLQGGVA
jgi:hypothetical protein